MLLNEQESNPVANSDNPVLLFVDDDERCLTLLKRVFKDTNYKCLYATSGQDALKIVKSRTIDAIVSDIRMPGMSGTELLELVRSVQPDTIRIAVSGNFDITSTIAAINKGAVSNYIVKPFVAKQLKLTIYKEILSREKKRNELDRVKAGRKNSADIARRMGSSLDSLKSNLAAFETATFELIEILAALDKDTFERAMLRKRRVMVLAKEMSISPGESMEAAMAALLIELDPSLLNDTSFHDSDSTFFQNIRELYLLDDNSVPHGEQSSLLCEIVRVAVFVDRMVNLEGINDVDDLVIRLSSKESIDPAVLIALSELDLSEI